jgi:hypothetical protein
MFEAMRVKFKKQWRLQEIRNVRSMKYLPKIAAGNTQSQPRRETKWALNSKTMRMAISFLTLEKTISVFPHLV